MIFSCSGISKSYGTDVILEKVTFNIEDKEKAAIVGVNGAGKTTLFKMITGETMPDGGDIFIRKDCRLGYLSQNTVFDFESSIYNEMLKIFNPIIDMENRLRESEKEMSALFGEALEKHMAEYSNLQHEFEQADGYSYKSRIKGVLSGLGFSPDDYDRPVSELSGGQKTRVFLGRLLLSKPDMLLLDEPTNHLDIESITWLEDFLRAYQGAVIIISHDRYFLDKIVTKTIEIENKKSYIYEGNYTFYAKQKAVNRQIQMSHYVQQQREIKHQEDVIEKLRSFNREKSIKRAESREKALEKITPAERPEDLPEKMRLTFSPKIISGNDVLHIEGLAKSFPSRPLFSDIDIDIKRGEKAALIGPNGIGKSTLLKILLAKETPDRGEIRLGTNVNIGYYDQEQHNFDENKTIFQEISDTYPTLTNGEIRNILAAFVFEGDDVFKVISSLSGGERGRVSLAKIFLSKANFLVLDEPTNHLDIYSKEILEDALNRYEGTVLYISHDRYFINKTAQKLYELSPKGARLFLGNYDYYIEKKTKEERERELFEPKQEDGAESRASDSKLLWQAQKEQQAKERRLKNMIEKTETQIDETEKQIESFDELLLTAEVSTDYTRAQEVCKQKEEAKKLLDDLYLKWEELQNEQDV